MKNLLAFAFFAFAGLCTSLMADSLHPTISLPVNCHNVISRDVNNATLTIEDGSVWEIKNTCNNPLPSWQTNHILYLYPNNSSSYPFLIVNSQTNEMLYVKPILGPLLDNPYRLTIIDVDTYWGTVRLNTNTSWDISWLDRHHLSKWKKNHTIIVGNYSSWISSKKFFLYNVDLNAYIRANPKSY